MMTTMTSGVLPHQFGPDLINDFNAGSGHRHVELYQSGDHSGNVAATIERGYMLPSLAQLDEDGFIDWRSLRAVVLSEVSGQN